MHLLFFIGCHDLGEMEVKRLKGKKFCRWAGVIHAKIAMMRKCKCKISIE